MTIGKELERIFDKLKSQIKVAIPCEVIKYDHTKQSVEVKTENGKIIPNIPIFQMTNNGVSGLFVPVSKGCYGALLSFDEDLSAYLNNAKSSYTTRKHDISDSYFIAGFTPKGSRLTLADGKCGLKNDNMSVVLHADGKIEINGNTEDFIKLINELGNILKSVIISLSTTTVTVAGAPVPLSSQADFAELVNPLVAGNILTLLSKMGDFEG
ncbi:hypothetical protein [Sulfurimonas sp.]|jgi:hypothetical protein|uniref:hypothetical protein n=1 Tax=Sulfurimonas sp. TaxID=2022749 RepID=UPI0025DF925D|nr:hypothetical protein [Sulfurimonas sp.]MCK9473731.1 hypothetical protein [Sulfurimonas sp.]